MALAMQLKSLSCELELPTRLTSLRSVIFLGFALILPTAANAELA